MVEFKPWQTIQSGNLAKSWIVQDGRKLTRLISTALAAQICKAHNKEVEYALGRYDNNTPAPPPPAGEQ